MSRADTLLRTKRSVPPQSFRDLHLVKALMRNRSSCLYLAVQTVCAQLR